MGRPSARWWRRTTPPTTASRALSASAAILRPSLEKISARIAVSEYARGTQVSHVGGEPVVIPNGLYVDRFAPRRAAAGAGAATEATVAFVGRLGEPRKGFAAAGRGVRARSPPTGPGCGCWSSAAATSTRPAALLPGGRARPGDVPRPRLGRPDKAAALRTADVYVAPNTGGESFGIVLVEAMAAGATVLASDIPAFRRVLDGGALGVLFANGDADDLAARLAALLDDPARRAALDEAARRRRTPLRLVAVAGADPAGLRDRRRQGAGVTGLVGLLAGRSSWWCCRRCG